MKTDQLIEVKENTPLLLRRAKRKHDISDPSLHPLASHMTIVTTQGYQPEMHDQQEDSTRYDQD